jgi:hypothetical protein
MWAREVAGHATEIATRYALHRAAINAGAPPEMRRTGRAGGGTSKFMASVAALFRSIGAVELLATIEAGQ